MTLTVSVEKVKPGCCDTDSISRESETQGVVTLTVSAEKVKHRVL